MIKVLIAEDQSLVLGAMSALLELDGGFTVVKQCSDGQQVLDHLANGPEELQPDIVLTDIEMPNVSGIQVAEALQGKADLRIVIMTTFAKAGYIRRAIDAGVKGFVLKEAPSDYLISSLKKVVQGERVIDSELALMALDDTDPLTQKERAALKLASEGLKTADIAERLFLSEGTVRNYLSEAIAKLNATNRVDASRIAQQKGWL
jgi:two-component system response regulator DesR